MFDKSAVVDSFKQKIGEVIERQREIVSSMEQKANIKKFNAKWASFTWWMPFKDS